MDWIQLPQLPETLKPEKALTRLMEARLGGGIVVRRDGTLALVSVDHLLEAIRRGDRIPLGELGVVSKEVGQPRPW